VVVDGARLRGTDWTMGVASAQVKSALLLAALRADGPTTVTEPLATRDHSERMLRHMGDAVTTDGTRIGVRGGQPLAPLDVTLPGDPSSAAFLAVAALLVPGSEIRIGGGGTNPLRTWLLAILAGMGAAIPVAGERDVAGEPVGEIVAKHGT